MSDFGDPQDGPKTDKDATSGGKPSEYASAPIDADGASTAVTKVASTNELAAEKRRSDAPARRTQTKIEHRWRKTVIMRHVLDEQLQALVAAPRQQKGLSAFAWASISGLGASITPAVQGIVTVFGSTPLTVGGKLFALSEIVTFFVFSATTITALVQNSEKQVCKTATDILQEIVNQSEEEDIS